MKLLRSQIGIGLSTSIHSKQQHINKRRHATRASPGLAAMTIYPAYLMEFVCCRRIVYQGIKLEQVLGKKERRHIPSHCLARGGGGGKNLVPTATMTINIAYPTSLSSSSIAAVANQEPRPTSRNQTRRGVSSQAIATRNRLAA